MYPLTEGETEARVLHTQARSTARTRGCWAPPRPWAWCEHQTPSETPVRGASVRGRGPLGPSTPECGLQGCCEPEWGKWRLYPSNSKANVAMSSKYECRRQATLAFTAPGTFFRERLPVLSVRDGCC